MQNYFVTKLCLNKTTSDAEIFPLYMLFEGLSGAESFRCFRLLSYKSINVRAFSIFNFSRKFFPFLENVLSRTLLSIAEF